MIDCFQNSSDDHYFQKVSHLSKNELVHIMIYLEDYQYVYTVYKWQHKQS